MTRGGSRSGRVDSQDLLAHQQEVARRHRRRAVDLHERPIRGAQVLYANLAVADRHHAMSAGDVAVLREADVAAPAADQVLAVLQREHVALTAPLEQLHGARDVARVGAAPQRLLGGRFRLLRKPLDPQTLAADAQLVSRLELALL